MISLIQVIVIFLSVQFCIATTDWSKAKIVNFENNQDQTGYHFVVDTDDGFHHDQRGILINRGQKDESLVVYGQYSYIGPDGVTYTVQYKADAQGFQPTGKHISGVGQPDVTTARDKDIGG